MKKLSEIITEEKQLIYSSKDIVFYIGDHAISRQYDRNIVLKDLEKLSRASSIEIVKKITEGTLNIGDELVLINKNVHPYLNAPIKYEKLDRNKYFIVIKTVMYKDNFQTSNIKIEKYA